MVCKFCKKQDAEWPENYVKGCSMIETDTGTIHTRERCDMIQHPQLHKPKKKWYIISCIQCGCESRLNPKFFNRAFIMVK